MLFFVFLREFTLDMSVEMPYEITSLECITHQIKIKVIWVLKQCEFRSPSADMEIG